MLWKQQKDISNLSGLINTYLPTSYMYSCLQLGNEQYLLALKKCCILYISPRGSICGVCCDYKVTISMRVGSSKNILRKKWACLVEVRAQASWKYSERCCCSLQKYITDVASPKWATWGTSEGVCFERKKAYLCLFNTKENQKWSCRLFTKF